MHFEIDCGKLTQFLGATLADLATKGKRLQLSEILFVCDSCTLTASEILYQKELEVPKGMSHRNQH